MMKSNMNPIKLANELKKSMDQLLNLADSTFAQLPPEHREKINPIQTDIHAVIDAAKKGDLSKINEINSKYANSDSK